MSRPEVNLKTGASIRITQEDTSQSAATAPSIPAGPSDISWPQLVSEGSDDDIKQRLGRELRELIQNFGPQIQSYCLLSIFGTNQSISSWDADRIFAALERINPKHEQNVLLLVYSKGGRIEPAYQISKLCRAYSKDHFIVTIPRLAKSAATLIAIGATQIHMGPLSELGPIDPQLGGMPALGVVQALRTIASLSEEFPATSDLFA